VTSDESVCIAMRDKGLEQACRFSWKRCAEETLACYRSLV